MNTLLWIGQALLAAVFLFSGIFKSIKSPEYLVKMGQTGVEGVPTPVLKFIGITEIMGSVGIILPWYLGVYPILTPIVAVCFAIIMVMAICIHLKRSRASIECRAKEVGNARNNAIILLVSILVAIGRFAMLD
ncbi:MAG: DoxX family protein [Bacteroidota bacterium]